MVSVPPHRISIDAREVEHSWARIVPKMSTFIPLQRFSFVPTMTVLRNRLITGVYNYWIIIPRPRAL
ncbi:hypothetical protein EI94DRAFT_1715996 [Lactarius quietus]|nr:hypothetical protein EI94DRAFT_1715996 [Lactarius quietus]